MELVTRKRADSLSAHLDLLDGYSGRSAFCAGVRKDLQIHRRPFADPAHVYDCGSIHARHLERRFSRIYLEPDPLERFHRVHRNPGITPVPLGSLGVAEHDVTLPLISRADDVHPRSLRKPHIVMPCGSECHPNIATAMPENLGPPPIRQYSFYCFPVTEHPSNWIYGSLISAISTDSRDTPVTWRSRS